MLRTNSSTYSLDSNLQISGKDSLIVYLILHEPFADAIFESSSKIILMF